MKQETLEEFADNYGWRIKTNPFSDKVKANELAESSKHDFIAGAKWQAERMYSEEEVLDLLYKRDLYLLNRDEEVELELPDEWFEQFKKK